MASVVLSKLLVHEGCEPRSDGYQCYEMAILLGGDAILEASVGIKRNYGPDFSVMQLMEQDGYLPSGWSSAEEKNIRAAIQRAG